MDIEKNKDFIVLSNAIYEVVIEAVDVKFSSLDLRLKTSIRINMAIFFLSKIIVSFMDERDHLSLIEEIKLTIIENCKKMLENKGEANETGA